MSARLPSGMVVGALLRRVNDSGGMGVVLARGEPAGGAILVIILKNGGNACVLEGATGPDGRPELRRWTPPDSSGGAQITDYWQRRRRNDPDLWVIELDSPSAERFTAETILPD